MINIIMIASCPPPPHRSPVDDRHHGPVDDAPRAPERARRQEPASYEGGPVLSREGRRFEPVPPRDEPPGEEEEDGAARFRRAGAAAPQDAPGTAA